ncbi:MAG: hypothetical protein AB7U45_02405 [Desulfamplus sp.]
MNRSELGSTTAKGGFANELKICEKFNNWTNDSEAKEWLKIMGYNIERIDSVTAIHIPTRIRKDALSKFNVSDDDYNEFVKFKKADAQIRIVIKIGEILKIENLSLKKANSNADYNQIDKRTIDSYQDMWRFDDQIAVWLKLFTGEITPEQAKKFTSEISPRDTRRVFIDEMPENIQKKIISFFENNKILVISDILKGRGGLSADWILVTRYDKNDDSTKWILIDINRAMNFYGSGNVMLSPHGSLYIGKITMQRKGGTPDPTKLQFKFKPCELFSIGE